MKDEILGVRETFWTRLLKVIEFGITKVVLVKSSES